MRAKAAESPQLPGVDTPRDTGRQPAYNLALFRPASDLPLELAALEGRSEPALLRWAAERAEELGLGGDEVLRARGLIEPDTYLHALGARLQLDIDWLEDGAPDFPDEAEAALQTGVLRRLDERGNTILTIAPRGRGIHALADTLSREPDYRARMRLTSPERLRAFLLRMPGGEIAYRAAYGLRDTQPQFSAALAAPRRFRFVVLFLLAAALPFARFFPFVAITAGEVLLGATFIGWTALKLFACLAVREGMKPAPLPENTLPVYSILVPLYREANVVPALLHHLSALDYPKEKLDIKLIVERDDPETLSALRVAKLDPCFEIFIADEVGPRTKPKALSLALACTRGEYVVVYDAEDQPEPSQLRFAVASFAAAPRELACLQARLAIDNAGDGWLTRHFAAEYAGLFDVLLPSLAAHKLPLPLGGTSNHFRTDALRRTGAWDPHNVTEDADLGIRLARFGYRTGVISSTTWEEAPARLRPWLRQRTRWMKGWMQTWLVHMRTPVKLFRELGVVGFAAFQLLLGGAVVAALVHPLFMLVMAVKLAGGIGLAAAGIAHEIAMYAVLSSGYLGSAALAICGMKQRGMRVGIVTLLTIPLYWILLSAAAWRALYQFMVAPHRWEKTEHGLAKTSRHALQPARFKVSGADRQRRRPHRA